MGRSLHCPLKVHVLLLETVERMDKDSTLCGVSQKQKRAL